MHKQRNAISARLLSTQPKPKTPKTTRQRTLYTQRHSRDAGGGGLAPSAANPEPWDLVPYSANDRTKADKVRQVQRCNSAQLENVHVESAYRVQIEQLEAAKIAESPGH